MQNPFAIAVQWPGDPRLFLIHLARPYFTAAVCETDVAAWLLVSWSPSASPRDTDRGSLFRRAAEFCRAHLDQTHVPIQFVERKNGHQLPRYLIAQTQARELFIVEPEHSSPLVEVREGAHEAKARKAKLGQRFDVITQWRLSQMRKYYQEFLEKQACLTAGQPAISVA